MSRPSGACCIWWLGCGVIHFACSGNGKRAVCCQNECRYSRTECSVPSATTAVLFSYPPFEDNFCPFIEVSTCHTFLAASSVIAMLVRLYNTP